MPTYSLSAGLFIFDSHSKPTGDPIEALERTATAGFQETELMAEGEAWDEVTQGDLGRLKSALEHSGLFPHTLHAPMSGIDLASGIEEIRRHGIDEMTKSMRILAELGGRTVIVHPSGRPGPDENAYSWENIGAAAERAVRGAASAASAASGPTSLIDTSGSSSNIAANIGAFSAPNITRGFDINVSTI